MRTWGPITPVAPRRNVLLIPEALAVGPIHASGWLAGVATCSGRQRSGSALPTVASGPWWPQRSPLLMTRPRCCDNSGLNGPQIVAADCRGTPRQRPLWPTRRLPKSTAHSPSSPGDVAPPCRRCLMAVDPAPALSEVLLSECLTRSGGAAGDGSGALPARSGDQVTSSGNRWAAGGCREATHSAVARGELGGAGVGRLVVRWSFRSCSCCSPEFGQAVSRNHRRPVGRRHDPFAGQPFGGRSGGILSAQAPRCGGWKVEDPKGCAPGPLSRCRWRDCDLHRSPVSGIILGGHLPAHDLAGADVGHERGVWPSHGTGAAVGGNRPPTHDPGASAADPPELAVRRPCAGSASGVVTCQAAALHARHPISRMTRSAAARDIGTRWVRNTIHVLRALGTWCRLCGLAQPPDCINRLRDPLNPVFDRAVCQARWA